jgi:RimJ/RimL family protein N-acetyltransferase
LSPQLCAVEGRLRAHEYFAGRRHDLVMMGLTVDEFTARWGSPATALR